jgi:plastocyanin
VEEKISVEMTQDEYRDLLLVQVIRAGEEAGRRKLALDEAEQARTEALERARSAGWTDDDLAAAAGLLPAGFQQIGGEGPLRNEDSTEGMTVERLLEPDLEDQGAEQLTVFIHDHYFQPRDPIIGAGDVLALSNLGAEVHSFTIEEADIDLDIEPGQSITADLSEVARGTYPFFCGHHRKQGMEGTIEIS